MLKNKIYIYNLCEKNYISIKTVNLLFEKAKSDLVDKKLINDLFGDTEQAKQILKEIEMINQDYLSVYALRSVKLNGFIIESIRKRFTSIEGISENLDKFLSLTLLPKTKLTVVDFINKYRSNLNNNTTNLDSLIKEILENKKVTIPSDELFSHCCQVYPSLNADMYFQSLNNLTSQGVINVTASGVALKLNDIDLIFNNNVDENMSRLFDRLKGLSINQIAIKFKLSRQAVDLSIKRTIEKLPLFENEKKYVNLLEKYQLSRKVLHKIGFNSELLLNYISLKYSLEPQKDEIDYIFDNLLEETSFGKEVFKNNGYVFISNKLVKLSLMDLFDFYCNYYDIVSFNLTKVFNDFRLFLDSNNLDYVLNDINYSVFKRKVLHTGNYLNCGNDRIYYFDENIFSDEFLIRTRDYLENFYGHGSVKFFFDNNEVLCREHSIIDEYQLFAVLKRIYSEDFESEISFSRNPSIRTLSLEIDQFFEDLIRDFQPIKVDDFFDYLIKTYGFKLNNLNWNFNKWFSKYIISEDTLGLEDEFQYDGYVENLKHILKDFSVLSFREYIKIITDIDHNLIEEFKRPYFLKKVGFKKTNTLIYSSRYKTVDLAIRNQIKNLRITISSQDLKYHFGENNEKILRHYNVFSDCIIIRFSDYNFLNIDKRLDRKKLINFRNKLVELLDPSDVITMNELIESKVYKDLIDDFIEVKKLINSMGYLILENLLKSSEQLSYLISSGTLIMSKRNRLSVKDVVVYAFKKLKIAERYELEYLLKEKFNIDIVLTYSYLRDIGLYLNANNGYIYDSKKSSDDELTAYLMLEGL